MAFLGLMLLAAVVAMPIMAFVALLRTGALQAEIRDLQQKYRELEARVEAASRHRAAPGEAHPVVPPPAVVPASPAPARPAEPPVPAPSVAAPAPPAAAPAPAPPPVSVTPPPAVVVTAPRPIPRVSSPMPAAEKPAPQQPPPSPPSATPAPPQTQPSTPAAASAPPQPPPAPLPPKKSEPAQPPPRATAPPPPRPPATPPPPTPRAPRFEWESLLGVKAAAIVGAVAVVIAGILFAKLAIESGFFTPELRVALILLTGVACLVTAELSMRRGYEFTANAVSGAGIALLYAGLFAGHALYHLIPVVPTFGSMALVTVVACMISIRYDAFFTAVLGLLGGFATPVALSTGEDRPIALFSYIFLLNLGLLAVARRKAWHGLVVLTVAATFLMQMGWFLRFFSESNFFTALAIFLGFGLLYLALPVIVPFDAKGKPDSVDQSALVGGLLPLFFAVFVANHPRYAGQWGLFPFVFLMTLGFLLTAMRRSWGRAVLVTVLATFLVQLGWLNRFFQTGNLLAALPAFAAFGLLFLLVPGTAPSASGAERGGVNLSRMIGGLIPLFFGLLIVLNSHYDGHWVLFPFLFFLSLGCLFVARKESWGGVVAGAVVLTFLVQLGWLARFLRTDNLLLAIVIFVAFGVLLLVQPARDSDEKRSAQDWAGMAGALIPLFFGCLIVLNPHYAGQWVLFVYLLLMTAGGLVMSRRRAWGGMVLVSILLTAVVQAAWLSRFLSPENLVLGLVVFLAFGLLFLLMPHTEKRPVEGVAPAELASMAGGLVPLLMGCLVVFHPAYTGHWALFLFVFAMAGGLLVVARRKGWEAAAAAGVLMTVLIQQAWLSRFLSLDNLALGLGIFLAFGLLHAGILGATEARPSLFQSAVSVGAVVPLWFGFLVAVRPALAGEWRLLFGYVALVAAALVVVSVLRGRGPLLFAGSLGVAVILPAWAANGITTETVLGATLGAAALTLLLNSPARVARALDRKASPPAFEAAGLVAGMGLLAFGLVLVDKGLGRPALPFLLLLVAACLVLLERSGPDRIAWSLPIGAAAVAALIQVWFFASTNADTVVPHLAVPLLFASLLSILAGVRAVSGSVAGVEDEIAALGPVGIAYGGLLICLGWAEVSREPLPFFAAVAVLGVLVVLSSVRRSWPWLLPLALLGCWIAAAGWHLQYFHAGDTALLVPVYAVFYLGFLVLPLASRGALLATWKKRPEPWFSSALSGPLFFVLLQDAISKGWGNAWIGLLPVTMAGLTVAGLVVVRQRFPAEQGRAVGEGRLRLRYLALFATVALGFIAVAIPLQLDRQWITVGWALLGAAVFWLFGRLPHGALKIVGGLLFAAVGARLLLNFENVMHYETGGLPVLNWLLYTYGVPAASCLFGSSWLRRAEARQGRTTRLPDGVALLGLVLIFALVNLEISHFFKGEHGYARDLTTSVAWAGYAISLLVAGVFAKVPTLRYISLGFLFLTVAKVFLYDLSALVGLYRILSFLGLGVSLILVSLFYTRFVFRTQEKK